MVRCGIQGCALPHDLPKWSTVYYLLHKWGVNGTWQTLNTAIRQQERLAHERTAELSGAIIYSQSAKGQHGSDKGHDNTQR